MSYCLRIRRSALKAIAALPAEIRQRVQARIDALLENPRPRGVVSLKGRHKGLWRVRVGAYRIIYRIDDRERVVTVAAVGPRESIYD